MKPTKISLPILAAIVCTFTTSCGRTEYPQPRLVVLYAACTLNKDYLSPYNDEIPYTPNFDRFAKDALVFDKHVTEAGQSGIAFASIFTGTQAFDHGAYRHPKMLRIDLYQVTEAFRDAGYETYFWSGQRMGSYELGYGQGVGAQNAYLRFPRDLNSYTGNGQDFAKVLDKLERDPTAKIFIQINLTLTHSPYQKYALPPVLNGFLRTYPGEANGMKLEQLERYIAIYDEHRLALQWNYEETIAQIGLTPEEEREMALAVEVYYKAAVAMFDSYFGRFVDRIDQKGLLDEALFAFTADHGEILHRENALYKWTHGLQLVPEVLNVPFMIRSPLHGIEPGHYDKVTRSIDVFPTIAGLCNIPIPQGVPVTGLNLAEAVVGDTNAPDLLAFSHTTTLGPNLLEEFKDLTKVMTFNDAEDVNLTWVRVRDGDLVCKWRKFDAETWGYEVFDVVADPAETTNLFDADDPRHRRMVDELLEYKAKLVEGYGRYWGGGAGVSKEEALRQLQGLGYVGNDE